MLRIEEKDKVYIEINNTYSVLSISSDLKSIKFIADNRIIKRDNHINKISDLDLGKKYPVFEFEIQEDNIYERLKNKKLNEYGNAKQWIQKILQFENLSYEDIRFYYVAELNGIHYSDNVFEMDRIINSKNKEDKRISIK